jgi:uncharacterized membrane protein YphA (DoxX/SURF4 family)
LFDQVNILNADPVSRDKIISIGRIFFATGLFGIGVQHLIYDNFIPVMVAWWPSWVIGGPILAYLVGAFLMVTGLVIVFGKRPRTLATLSGILFLVFIVLFHIPRHIIDHAYTLGDWTNTFKEFAFSGSAMVVAGSLPADHQHSDKKFLWIDKLERIMIPFAKYPLAIMVFVFGIDHFIYTDFVASLVPRWIPGEVFWTYFAGVALILAGVGIIFNIKARLAATLLGTMIFIWFLILHIPRAIADPYSGMGNEWTSVCEALAFSGIAFILGRTLPAGKRQESID